MFLVLPVIARRVAQSFRCSEYDEGEYRYLQVDSTIDCDSEQYSAMFVFAAAMVLVSLDTYHVYALFPRPATSVINTNANPPPLTRFLYIFGRSTPLASLSFSS